MRDATKRRLLILDAAAQRYRLRTLHAQALDQDPRADYFLLSGETLCQYLLREDPRALVIARGPLAFLSGNKTTIGYVSPLTGLPHYSFVGGRGFAELLNLGLDAILLTNAGASRHSEAYAVISGRAPDLTVEWRPAEALPRGQRSAYYWLVQRELDGNPDAGSVFTIGAGAHRGYRTANLAVDSMYHAGRGGAGHVFADFIPALVLRGTPVAPDAWLGPARAAAFYELRDGEIRERLERYGARLSRRDGGTVTKLHTTGSGENPTLPARNAQRLGYALADLGSRPVLSARRAGQTGCHWCQVNCRHWHWVDVDYAPQGRDRFLDDFEPTYAIFAMLDLKPADDTLEARLRLWDAVEQRVILPIEQIGCDVMDIGVGLAALFEGLSERLIPHQDVPDFLHDGPYLGSLDKVARTLDALRAGSDAPALRALGDGPQALAVRYPALQDHVFTCGPGTLGNAGHSNALWTFMMPFSRFFGHYSGQIYKIAGQLQPDMTSDEVDTLFQKVVHEMLQREFYSCIGNALSTCAFTFVIFSQDGKGRTLDRSDLLERTLAAYGIEVRRDELAWFAEAFWAQSIALKLEHGWRPPQAADFPARVFEALSQTLDLPPDALEALLDRLIGEWKHQAGALLYKYGWEVGWYPSTGSG